MSYYTDYVETNAEDILSDWQKHMVDENKKRRSEGLEDKIYSEKEFDEFTRKWVEDRSIWLN